MKCTFKIKGYYSKKKYYTCSQIAHNQKMQDISLKCWFSKRTCNCICEASR